MSLSAQLFGRDSFIFKATNALGLGIPGWLDKKFGPKETEGTRLEDLSVQTSTYGADIPRLYGTISMAGNILWLEGGKLKEVVKKNKKGGKGGASTTPTKTYTYFATFALGLCEGPIAGVRRIWCSDTLLYNADSDDLETIIASNKNATGWKLYLGTDDQQPDSRYEADVGAGNAPAFRGLAYLVFYDFELTDYANTLQASQFKVEICQYAETKDPLLIKSIQFPAPEVLYKTSALYCNADGEMTVFRGINDSIGDSTGAKVLTTSPDGSYHADGVVGVSVNPYLQGWADRPVAAIYGSSGVGVIDASGVNVSSFALSEASWVNTRYYLVDGLEYVVQQANTGATVYERSYGSMEQPSVLLGPDSSILDSGIYDIFPRGTSLFVLTFGKRFYCLSRDDLSIKWEVDLSSITQLSLIVDAGTEKVLLRSDSDDHCYIRRIGEFWKISRDGYEYLGNEPAIGESYNSLGGNCVIPGLWVIYASQQGRVLYVRLSPDLSASPTLGQVVTAEVTNTQSLFASDVDVSELTQRLRGYKVASGSVRSALEPLQTAYPFDVVQSGYKVRISARGKNPVTEVAIDELYAGEEGDDEALSQSREMDSQLPARVTVKYLDADREYDVSQQRYERASTASVDESTLDLALVMDADQAAQVAEVMCYLAWLERSEFSFTLPPAYLLVEPSDVITLRDDEVSYELRITETSVGLEGRVECKAVPNKASLYASNAVGGTGVIPSGVVTLPGRSLAVLLDIPVIDETTQNDPGVVAAVTGYTAGWPGAVLIGSSDNGQTYMDLQGFSGKATLGTAAGKLQANGGTVIDMSSISVSLISGQLESVTRDQMLSGINYAAYGQDGRWEIVRFQNAVLQSDGSYLVSGFLRGQRGTEWATGTHEDGDRFVLLDDPDNAFIDLPASALAEARLYKAVTSRQSADDAATQSFTYKGVNLQPLSPVYARGSRNAGSLTVIWTRRSRLSSSWWTTGMVAPLGESSESYEVDVMSGSSVVRTIATTSAAITYTAAQQQADFGSVQGAITLRIFQLSSAVGRGRALEVTL